MRLFLWLLILFPLLELLVLIQMGNLIGGLNTIALVILSAMMGLHVLRNQRLVRLFQQYRGTYNTTDALYQIITKTGSILAGILLLIPGFISDLIGLILLIPAVPLFLSKFVLSKKKHNQANNTYEAEFYYQHSSEDQISQKDSPHKENDKN